MAQENLATRDDGDTVATKSNNQVAEYSKTEAELSALREVCATTVYDVKTPSGMKQATSLRAKVRTLRTGVEKLRKEAKAPVLALGKLIDSEAERITAELLLLEKPIDEKIKAEEKRKSEEKKIEADRVAKVQEWFDSINKIVKESAISKLTTMLYFAEKGENDRAELAEKTKQLEQLSVKPIDNELHLVELKGVTCNVIVRQSTQETSEDMGIEYSEFEEIVSDMVAIPRAEYKQLLYLTTPKPIDTLHYVSDEDLEFMALIINPDGFEEWVQSWTDEGNVIYKSHGEKGLFSPIVIHPTHWLPLPNTTLPITAKPKLEDADDALGR